MTKKRSKNQKLEELSRSKLRALLSDWIVNDLPNDFGFDFEVRLCSSMDFGIQEVSESSFYIQVKASISDEKFYDLDVDDWILFVSQKLPVVLIKYCERTDIFYWEIVQTYVWDVLEKSNPDWRKKKKRRIKLKNKLEDLELFRKYILDAQKRIVRHSVLSLDLGEGIDERERETHKQRFMSEYKDMSFVDASSCYQEGNRSKAITTLETIYKLPYEDKYKLEAIINWIFQVNPVNPEFNKKIIEISDEGIELSRSMGVFNFEHILIILKNQAKLVQIIIKISQLMCVKKIQSTVDEDIFLALSSNELTKLNQSQREIVNIIKSSLGELLNNNGEDVFSLYSSDELIKLKQSYQQIVNEINNSQGELLKNNYPDDYIRGLSVMIEIVTFQTQRFVPINLDVIKEEVSGGFSLILQCDYIVENIKDFDLRQQMYAKLSKYYYWICEKDKAIDYISKALEIVKEKGNISLIEEYTSILKQITEKPDPYSVGFVR